jgi:hypothetical protein
MIEDSPIWSWSNIQCWIDYIRSPFHSKSPHVIWQQVCKRPLYWNFISQWSSQPFNRTLWWKLFSNIIGDLVSRDLGFPRHFFRFTHTTDGDHYCTCKTLTIEKQVRYNLLSNNMGAFWMKWRSNVINPALNIWPWSDWWIFNHELQKL